MSRRSNERPSHRLEAALIWAAIAGLACGVVSAEDDPQASAEDDALYAIPERSPGHAQSPINILSDATTEGHHALQFGGGGMPIAKTVAYTGDTVRIRFQSEGTLRFDDQVYSLKQCHFHTPSEHQIDGITYPMEMHCVARRPPETGEQEPGYLVLAYLFRMGESNQTIARLLAGHPHRGETLTLTGEAPIAVIDLLDGLTIAGHYYSYEGSLTTPPYSETVRWVIDKEIREASPEEITLLNALEGNNARHIQPSSGREIEAE
jgi:carbonic anhydrase